MRKISVALILILCLHFLGGCWDKRELEDDTFAVLLGIDTAENRYIIVTVAFPLTQTEGGGLDLSGDGGSNYSVMSVKAPTMVEALNMFSVKLSGPLALYSVKTVVISEEIARDDMLRQVFSSWRYEEIRNTTNVLISECTAAEFIGARIKNSPIDPMRQEELLLEQANGSAYYKPIQLLELLISLKSDSGDGIAMYGGIAAENKSGNAGPDENEQEDDEGQNGENIKKAAKDGYLPDELPLSASNESRISGLAVFRGAKMVGVMNSQEAQIYSMLTQSNTKKILTIQDPLDPEYNISVEILPAGKNRISSTIDGGVPVFYIDINLKCTVECIQSGTDYSSSRNYDILTEFIRDTCARNMTDLINKTQREYNADILKLGDKLAYHFSTVGEWERYDWPEKYKDAEINLIVNLNIERAGILMA